MSVFHTSGLGRRGCEGELPLERDAPAACEGEGHMRDDRRRREVHEGVREVAEDGRLAGREPELARGRDRDGRIRAQESSANSTVKRTPISIASLPVAANSGARAAALNASMSGHSHSA